MKKTIRYVLTGLFGIMWIIIIYDIVNGILIEDKIFKW
jgi:hypothetical protein